MVDILVLLNFFEFTKKRKMRKPVVFQFVYYSNNFAEVDNVVVVADAIHLNRDVAAHIAGSAVVADVVEPLVLVLLALLVLLLHLTPLVLLILLPVHLVVLNDLIAVPFHNILDPHNIVVVVVAVLLPKNSDIGEVIDNSDNTVTFVDHAAVIDNTDEMALVVMLDAHNVFVGVDDDADEDDNGSVYTAVVADTNVAVVDYMDHSQVLLYFSYLYHLLPAAVVAAAYLLASYVHSSLDFVIKRSYFASDLLSYMAV